MCLLEGCLLELVHLKSMLYLRKKERARRGRETNHMKSNRLTNNLFPEELGMLAMATPDLIHNPF